VTLSSDRENQCPPRRVDVVIVGGGPAGSSFAIALGRAGWQVVVLERSAYESFRIGETLPPEIRVPLVELGVWDRFVNDGHSPSPGISSAWGSPRVRNHDFLFNPYGLGWHINRCRFDAMLAAAAEVSGAEIVRGARLTGLERLHSGAWDLEATAGGTTRRFVASVLVDASGRSPSLARRHAGRRIVVDRLIGLVGVVTGGTALDSGNQRTLIEAVADGWWYSVQVPGGQYLAAFMTDGDLPPWGRGRSCSYWWESLRAAPLTHTHLGAAECLVSLKTVAANTSRLIDIVGHGRLAIGDAAATLDPLSSQGVYRALVTGLEAADAVNAHFRGDSGALDKYSQRVVIDFAADLETKADYYNRERRWPDSPFWRRRHV